MRTDSSQFEQFTLGIEEEFQIVDPNTRELRSHVSEILEEGRMLLGEQVKPEMIQSMIEVGTGICKDIKEARTDITNLRSILSTLVRRKGLEIVAAGTHPFSHWQDQKIFENARYELIVEENQMIARSLLTFGLHVHVGVADPERAIHSFVNYWNSLTMLLMTCAREKRSGTSTPFLSEVLRPTTSFESGARRATSKLSWTT